MRRWSLVVSWLLVGATILNIAGVATYFLLKEEIRQAKPRPTLRRGDSFPRFSGIDLQGLEWISRDAPCRVIRISDDNCSYCRQDKAFYDAILGAAAEASCEAIEIAPTAGGMAEDLRPGVVQLRFVDTDVGAVLFPFVTPQTIVLDQGWTVRKTIRGALDENSRADTIALLRALLADRGAQ
jgi:hypothetical protein